MVDSFGNNLLQLPNKQEIQKINVYSKVLNTKYNKKTTVQNDF